MANPQFPEPTAPVNGAPSSAVTEAASTCLGCGQAVDPLRAGHVAILEGRFRYFCGSACKKAYLTAAGRPQEEDVATARPPDVALAGEEPAPAERILSEPRARAAEPTTDAVEASADAPADASADTADPARLTLPSPEAAPASPRRELREPSRRGEWLLPALDALGIVLGALAPAIALLGPVGDVARLPLVAGAWTALALRVAIAGRHPSDPHPLLALAPSAGAVGAACWARLAHDPRQVAIAALAGLACAASIAIESLAGRARQRVCAAHRRLERALDVPVRALRGEDTVEMHASEVRPGEQLIAEAGDVVGVDATVTAGDALVVPWLDAGAPVTKREGDPVVAGARVVASRLRMLTTWSGRERAWLKLSSNPGARIDVAAPTARVVRLVVERGAPVAGLLAAVASFAAGATPVEILAAGCAGAMALPRAVASFAALHFARAHLEALAHGITYKDARAFERAAAANLAVLSARGTVLMGEPEIVAVEPVGSFDAERVLSLAAGAETASTHPFAAAILRAARVRGVRADDVRNATAHAGLGVTASASSGERLVVGGRAIMLEEKIGVAAADARVTELEAQGRSVLLVALGDRLVGLIALQDGLRPGARAAVQRLLDAHIEPVLVSGEARETCETIGRSLDIEHVRPEVLPADRGAEVRALAEGGSIVAVVGHPARDDGALGAADVAVAMGAAGSTPGEWAVALAGDDVRDAALALAIPHATRERARVAAVLGVAPGVVALLAIGFGVAPLAVAPLAAAGAAIALAAHARESAAARG